ncbi:uncharacterized protein [Physcomitrium patens]|uniref:ARM repeat N-terminal plant domain-containing protein n=2 Tax=Physcomitrium patens TaxID=3218 RepID=A9THA5_PHYPA|nr:uncharacterized protein LOC112290926 isoform X2 [Physcomitrium patens]XP_024393554.1 uncharacterized protein LOC112290926 isoform X2 [Physcomitrium patens]XP_024393563.1 uncharacterized protein LOC112290926 isoform X2 [Physcomitrium patens]PNR62247.1 hypothetical protein PHYPA_000671 [Physcomitrium patens]|eukprot:XP_024393545.1 uncharacterized protein LOC112290926 isoform X2 [Physcomitrella patens]
MERHTPDCPYLGCLFCVMKETNQSKWRANVANFFKEFSTRNEDCQVLAVSSLWNTAKAHPNDPEFIELGIFECMAQLIWKGIKNRNWLAQDHNIFIPYYAAHIIGSYSMNTEEFALRAVRAGVIPALVELLRCRLTWVELRVAVRALHHLATYESTFPAVAAHRDVLELSIQLALNALEIVYTHFLQFVDKRMSYHCDLLTRGMDGLEMESRKAEEWASQLQCWSLQLITCFALREEFLPTICQVNFLGQLPHMWGGLVNENSAAGVGVLHTICYHKLGRLRVAECPGIIEALCNIARSSDDWQYMAVDCLVCLVQDPNTRLQVLDKAAVALVDLAESPNLGEHKSLGEVLTNVLLEDYVPYPSPAVIPHISTRTRHLLDDFAAQREKIKWEKTAPKEDLHLKQAAALVVKLEGFSKFSAGDISGAAAKYSEALSLCPVRAKKERVVLHSKRAQCHLLLHDAEGAISDTTRALSIHNPANRHRKSLWRRAQAYELLSLHKESLLDAIMFVNECSQQSASESDSKSGSKIPDYVERLVKKQMQASWLFKDAAVKHGNIQFDVNDSVDSEEFEAEEADDDDDVDDGESEWETASESEEAAVDGKDNPSKQETNRDLKRPIARNRPVFKGITLQDLLGQ